MEIQKLIILALIGIGAGLLSGFMGVGGGILIVPALIYFMGMTQHAAQGTSIAAIMLLPVGILSVLNYHKEGNVNFAYSAAIALFFLLGSFFGSRWAQGIDVLILKRIFAVIMILIAVKMLFETK